ncbi:ATP-binding SpoIIE family protein phosphatase [Streptomyces sp. NPDC051135]|uniref:ATP-binding SpoIIE family protein phosphatase n=1 Tax=unclassified Streptomyces TaxID=2593676 RepID=UPI0034253899
MTFTVVAEAGEVHWLRADVALAPAARRHAGNLARDLGMPQAQVARVELCVTEMATNMLKYAHDGSLVLRVVRARDRAAVECLSLDSGPGIRNVQEALRDGISASGSLGIGLGTIARMADVSGVHSLPGRGTVVHARFWAEGENGAPAAGPLDTGGLTRPLGGEQACGDTWAVRTAEGPDALLLMMCDGLGHGPLAAQASDRARGAFRASSHTDPARVLEDIHQALRNSRGAAVAVALVEPAAQRVRVSGAGNITALAATSSGRTGLPSLPGIAGVQLPRPRTFEAALPPGAALIMHSDGLSDRWKPADFPGLLAHDSSVVAAQIFSQAAVRRDDAGIVVAVHRQP